MLLVILTKYYLRKIILDLFIGTFTSLQRGELVRLYFLCHILSTFSSQSKIKNLTIIFFCFQSKSANVLAVLGGVASEALDLTGFYFSGKPNIVKRTNKGNWPSNGRYHFNFLPIFHLWFFSCNFFQINSD